MKNRQSKLLVNIDNMVYNYNQIQKMQPDKIILPVLKANGYGIGLEAIDKFIKKMNLNYFGAAIVDEGVDLREKLNFKGKIIVLNQPSVDDIENIVKYDMTPGCCYFEFINELNKKAEELNKKISIHIEIETGMGRTGVQLKNLENFMNKVIKLKNIVIEGIYTHFATSDTDINYTKKQIEVFEEAVQYIKSRVASIKYVHCGNSSAVMQVKDLPGNMIRPGIILHGYFTDECLIGKMDLKPTCVLKSKICYIKEVEENTSISYGRTFVTKRKSIIANVPIGYADGIRRSLSNNGYVVIKEKLAPIVGKVCMDSFMIDVTDIPGVEVGDDVYIWDNKIITLDDVAKKCDTINYEILATISNRVIREIVEEESK